MPWDENVNPRLKPCATKAGHFNSRTRSRAKSRNAASSGVVLPRHNAPINAGGKSFSGSARTFAGNGRFGIATPSPMPRPFAT